MLFEKKELKVDDRLSHIAFIMDGNGRWAKKHGLPRQAGHIQGAKTFEKVLKVCKNAGIKTVTVYAFSTENWKRPKEEVDSIMSLLSAYLDKATKEKNVRYVFLGDKSDLSEELRERMIRLENDTKEYEYTVNIAINYGGRAEIVHAINSLISNGKRLVTEEDVSRALYTCNSKDPDLIVRTANEYRISNFLLWQSAYSEYYFTDVLWPDFNKKELYKAIEDFYKRRRNFGDIPKE